MWHLTKPDWEVLEMIALLVIIVLSWHRNTAKPLTVGFGLFACTGLFVDVYVWHCVRPWYVQEAFNLWSIGSGVVIIYENVKKYLLELLVLLLSLFR